MTVDQASILENDRHKRVQTDDSALSPRLSHLDRLSGHQKDQDCQGDEKQRTRDTVTIREAARRCCISDKTIQRAIRRGFLPGRYSQPNRCEIALSDLEMFLQKRGRSVQTLPEHHLAEQGAGRVQTLPEQCLDELEQRVCHLERLVDDLVSRQDPPKPRRLANTRERTTGPLPRHLVSLLTFARYHNVTASTVETHTDMRLLPVKRGEWTDADGTVVTLALDAKGRAAFSQLYHGIPLFIPCKQCPH